MTTLKTSLDHLAIATTDGAALERFLAGALGGHRDCGGEHHDHADSFCGGQWRFPGNGKVEVLEPLGGPESRMRKFLRGQVARIHHATFFVDDLNRATALARDLGFDVAEGRPVNGWREAYLSPKQTFGLLFQLVDASSDYAAVGLLPHWKGFSSEPANVASSARIAALRLRAHSRVAAERLLGDLLGGRQDGLCFRWPGSNTEIQIVEDASLPEGPIAIELGGAQPALVGGSPASDLFVAAAA